MELIRRPRHHLAMPHWPPPHAALGGWLERGSTRSRRPRPLPHGLHLASLLLPPHLPTTAATTSSCRPPCWLPHLEEEKGEGSGEKGGLPGKRGGRQAAFSSTPTAATATSPRVRRSPRQPPPPEPVATSPPPHRAWVGEKGDGPWARRGPPPRPPSAASAPTSVATAPPERKAKGEKGREREREMCEREGG